MTKHQKFNCYLTSFLLISLLFISYYTFFSFLKSKKTITEHTQKEITIISQDFQTQAHNEIQTISKQFRKHLENETERVTTHFCEQYSEELKTVADSLKEQIKKLFQTFSQKIDQQIENLYSTINEEKSRRIDQAKEFIENKTQEIKDLLVKKIEIFLNSENKDKILDAIQERISEFARFNVREWLPSWTSKKK